MIAADLNSVQVWVATTPVDMRKSFDGLAEVVRSQGRRIKKWVNHWLLAFLVNASGEYFLWRIVLSIRHGVEYGYRCGRVVRGALCTSR